MSVDSQSAGDLIPYWAQEHGGALDLTPTGSDGQALMKSAAGMAAEGQPYRISAGMYATGAYDGVREARTASLTTARILRQIPNRNPVIAAIQRREQNRCAAAAKRPRFDGDLGFEIKMRDADRPPGPATRKRIREIEDVILRGGYLSDNRFTGEPGVWDFENAQKAMNFSELIRAFVADSTILDAAAINFQNGVNRRKYPIVWMRAVDASLIRYTNPKGFGSSAVNQEDATISDRPYRPEIRKDMQGAAYVMMDPGGNGVQAEYAWNELGYLVRNPRTDQWVRGYGYSELEMLVDIITGMIYGIKYNTEFFDSNHIPPAMLLMTGRKSQEVENAFRTQLRMMIGGPDQFWAMPILWQDQPNQAQMLPMRSEMDQAGMFWKDWLLFCATIACAVYGMDSQEINFVNFGQSTSALGTQNPGPKMEMQQEIGWESRMAIYETFMDQQIAEKFDDGEFAFHWTGLNRKDEMQESQVRTSRMADAISTPNMERAKLDQMPIYDPLDTDLWEEIKDQVDQLTADADDSPLEYEMSEEERLSIIVKGYKQAGGKFAEWPNAPVGNAAAMQVWMQEHGMGQGAQAAQAAPGQEQSQDGDPGDPGDGEDPDGAGEQAQDNQDGEEPGEGQEAGVSGSPSAGISPGPAQSPQGQRNARQASLRQTNQIRAHAAEMARAEQLKKSLARSRVASPARSANNTPVPRREAMNRQAARPDAPRREVIEIVVRRVKEPRSIRLP